MARQRLSREPTDAVVDGFTHGGEGVVRIEGKAVFVPGTIPGETVRVRVVDDRRNWARAELVEVVEASPDRVEPPCPYVPECGGCDLQHVTPEAQRRLKHRVVVEQLERLGKLVDPPVDPCRSVGPDTGYRTHARFHAADDGRLGFHRAGSHDVVPIDTCLILAPTAQHVRDVVGDHTGAAEVQVRGHDGTGAATAVLHPDPDAALQMPGSHDEPVEPDIVLAQPGGETMAFRGDGVLADEVAGFTFRFDSSSFFQVSPQGAQAIVDEVLAAAGDVAGTVAWDLYAGVGLLSLSLARAGADVVAVEGHQTSVEWLTTNAEDHGLTERVRTVAEDVADFVADDHGEAPDVVVLDPPRTGAGPGVCERLAALRPGVIVYVACDPAALARDAKVLAEHGFTMRRAVPLDLFPMTHHVEVVATFVA